MASVAGVVGGLLALAGWLYALFGPTGSTWSSEIRSDGTVVTSTSSSSLWADGVSPVTMAFLVLVLACIIGVSVGSLLRRVDVTGNARRLVLLSASVLLLGAVISGFSIGLFLLPGALVSLVAGVMPDRRQSSVAGR